MLRRLVKETLSDLRDALVWVLLASIVLFLILPSPFWFHILASEDFGRSITQTRVKSSYDNSTVHVVELGGVFKTPSLDDIEALEGLLAIRDHHFANNFEKSPKPIQRFPTNQPSELEWALNLVNSANEPRVLATKLMDAYKIYQKKFSDRFEVMDGNNENSSKAMEADVIRRPRAMKKIRDRLRASKRYIRTLRSIEARIEGGPIVRATIPAVRVFVSRSKLSGDKIDKAKVTAHIVTDTEDNVGPALWASCISRLYRALVTDLAQMGADAEAVAADLAEVPIVVITADLYKEIQFSIDQLAAARKNDSVGLSYLSHSEIDLLIPFKTIMGHSKDAGVMLPIQPQDSALETLSDLISNVKYQVFRKLRQRGHIPTTRSLRYSFPHLDLEESSRNKYIIPKGSQHPVLGTNVEQHDDNDDSTVRIKARTLIPLTVRPISFAFDAKKNAEKALTSATSSKKEKMNKGLPRLLEPNLKPPRRRDLH
jgi:hypothetical protein